MRKSPLYKSVRAHLDECSDLDQPASTIFVRVPRAAGFLGGASVCVAVLFRFLFEISVLGAFSIILTFGFGGFVYMIALLMFFGFLFWGVAILTGLIVFFALEPIRLIHDRRLRTTRPPVTKQFTPWG